jgi:hypothetical protein
MCVHTCICAYTCVYEDIKHVRMYIHVVTHRKSLLRADVDCRGISVGAQRQRRRCGLLQGGDERLFSQDNTDQHAKYKHQPCKGAFNTCISRRYHPPSKKSPTPIHFLGAHVQFIWNHRHHELGLPCYRLRADSASPSSSSSSSSSSMSHSAVGSNSSPQHDCRGSHPDHTPGERTLASRPTAS